MLAVVASLSISACAHSTSLARSDGNDCQNHVQPLEDIQGYYAALEKLLLQDAAPRASILWVPSFSQESAVSLSEKAGRWYVRTASVDSPVWRWKKDSGRKVPDFHTDQPVKVIEREFPADVAERFVENWRHVLQRTRAERKRWTIPDGEGYVFSAGGLRGQDANLTCGIGHLMIKSASELENYAHASDKISRWGPRVRLQKILSQIERDDYDR
jgi:hypothetical protein